MFAPEIHSISKSLSFLVAFPMNALPSAPHHLHKPDTYTKSGNFIYTWPRNVSAFWNHRTGLMPDFFWCPVQTKVWISEPPRGLSGKSLSPCNQQMALPSCLSSERPLFSGPNWHRNFLATDVPLHPAHHRGCPSDRGAAHQNAIRTLLATRRTHAQNASCGAHSVPFNSSSRLPLHFTVSLRHPNSPSPEQTEQSIQWHFLGLCWQTNLAKGESRPLAGYGGRRRCGHVNKSISGALDGWDL